MLVFQFWPFEISNFDHVHHYAPYHNNAADIVKYTISYNIVEHHVHMCTLWSFEFFQIYGPLNGEVLAFPALMHLVITTPWTLCRKHKEVCIGLDPNVQMFMSIQYVPIHLDFLELCPFWLTFDCLITTMLTFRYTGTCDK